jgi:hypothetical protein
MDRANHGSNPKGGAVPSAYQLHTPIALTAAPPAAPARIRHIPQVLARPAVSRVGKETAQGCKLNPRVEPVPHAVGYPYLLRIHQRFGEMTGSSLYPRADTQVIYKCLWINGLCWLQDRSNGTCDFAGILAGEKA